MPDDISSQITRILKDPELAPAKCSEQLFPLVYQQLRALAQKHMGNERRDHTLTATALVHEAYLRLAPDQAIPWENRAHFFFAAANAMRRILIDHARARGTQKRGGAIHKISGLLDLANEEEISNALILEDLISRLEKEDDRAAQVVRLRFYAGLSVEETALALQVSEPTVKREWAFARAWLLKAMQD